MERNRGGEARLDYSVASHEAWQVQAQPDKEGGAASEPH